METKHKVKNLSTLRKTIKISGVPRVIDSLALFNRLVMISDRQGEVCDAFAFELTPNSNASFLI